MTGTLLALSLTGALFIDITMDNPIRRALNAVRRRFH